MTKRKQAFSQVDPGTFYKKSKLAARTAAGVAGFYYDGLPGASFAYGTSGQALDYMFPDKGTDVKPFTKKNHMVYQGRFCKPRRGKKMGNPPQFGKIREEFGKVADPNGVMLIHSTKNIGLVSEVIVGLFFRALFKKAGYNIGSQTEEMPLSGFLNSGGFRVEYSVQNAVTHAVTLNEAHDSVDNQTFESFKFLFVDFIAHISSVIARSGTGIDTVPYKLVLYTADVAPGTSVVYWRMASVIDMQTQMITLNCSSEVVIQNTTLAVGATVAEADRLDSQPLDGKIYNFSQASPKINTPSSQSIDSKVDQLPFNGLGLIRVAELENGEVLSPFPSKYFSNCVYTCNILLQPGTMKKSFIKHVYSGRLLTILDRMKSRNQSATAYCGGSGTSQLVYLQEKMRTNSVNKVQVTYERNMKVLGWMKPTRVPPLLIRTTNVNLDNVV